MRQPRILLIDDEEEFVQTLVERLEFRDISAKGVITGKEALKCLEQEHFDVVVVDLKMPEIDGIQVKRIVERDYPGTRVILVTGHGRQEPQEGFNPEIDEDILMKPFGIRALLGRIQSVVQNREAKSGKE